MNGPFSLWAESLRKESDLPGTFHRRGEILTPLGKAPIVGPYN